MTPQEFIEKHGETELAFDGYYKFRFTYASHDASIVVSVGGDSNDIYRATFTPKMTFNALYREVYEATVVLDGNWEESLELSGIYKEVEATDAEAAQ